MKKVAVIGAGAYGTALGEVLKRNGNAVYFYDPYKFPERRLEDVWKFAEVGVVAVPARALEEVLGEVSAENRRKPLVIATKGVMGLEPYEQFEKVEFLGGPGFAEDLKQGKRVKLTATGEMAKELFENEAVKIETTEDKMGVVLLGGLKNVYAIEAGRRGLKLGTEEFREYLMMILREAERFLIYNGGFLETVRLSAGVGDFVLTCGDERSRNYQFGRRFRGILRAKKASLGWENVGENFGARNSGKTGVGAIFERRAKLRKNARGRLVFEMKKYLSETTVEGVFAAREIGRRGLAVPKENEILEDILRRLKNVV